MTAAHQLLDIAREAAAAGAAVLAGRDDVAPSGLALGSDGVETKSSESDLVTDFDRRAEQAVRTVLRRRRPEDTVTGEEYGTVAPDGATGYRWSIDPLDGTTNFVRGILYYGTSVAVQGPDGQWLVGVVHAPGLRRLWWASRDGGAFTSRLDGEGPGRPIGDPVRLRGPRGSLSAGLLSTGFGYDPERRAQQTAAVAAMLDSFGNLRRLGAAALDICMVADGTVEAFAEFGIQEHDWSAAALIAEEAGVPVRRPAVADSSVRGDWCLIGDIGIPHTRLRPLPIGLAEEQAQDGQADDERADDGRAQDGKVPGEGAAR
ncbi:inositol monophosphatase family protein [Nesterenkonia sp. PF2B19]|uniref:inositol monophosphatase family protein n=1 Tax=Nesterenkonia sp. PF2B19 TaxID=1881858 RepID=UPI000A19B5E9|nr:inositol monophosphatase family protein [Nesterenkonia sp. PF2B19]OSM43693.1 inositol monophosphatase [Nesterenkonia sp. PF2B19]